MERQFTPRPPISTGLACRCPRCGEGRLFSSFITLKPSCKSCGLDFSFADSADGPAVFVMFVAGALVTGVALWLEFTYEPIWWVHLLVQIPLVSVVCLGLLRPFKGLLIALQFANKAEQGRLEK